MTGSTPARRSGRHLTVDGERFTVLGAELHNSSSSTPEAIVTSFERAAALGANTVLAPLAWELFEQAEGVFDHTLLDAMLQEARRLGVRLIVLWFGSWKNGLSSYAPEWVKLDTARFPRAETTDHGRIEHLSPFSAQTRSADARAFAALMSHLRQNDPQHTVILVQVENEVGLLGDARDRSDIAEAAWNAPVPRAVVDAVAGAPDMPVHASWAASGCRTSGSWPEVFGVSEESEEAFMAWAYASAVEEVAAGGARISDVPLFVNAWLDVPPVGGGPTLINLVSGGTRPGVYPSGGPVVRVAPIWKACAPAIAFLAPDIYAGDFRVICAEFAAASGILLIPEMHRSKRGVAQMLLALGEFGAAGVAPFGVDSLAVSDPGWATLADGYTQLRAAAESLRTHPDAVTRGFLLEEGDPAVDLVFGDVMIRVEAGTSGPSPSFPAYGLAIEESPGRILLIGRGFTATFPRIGTALANDSLAIGILAADELGGPDGRTVTRRFNGDETLSGRLIVFPPVERQDPGAGIASASEKTGIVRLRLYRY